MADNVAKNIIVESSLLFDIDLGIIRYIRKNLADPEIFNVDTLELPYSSFIGLLQERENKNPISIIINDDISEQSIENIYNELVHDRIKDIFTNYTESTEMLEFILLKSQASDGKVTVICEDYEPIDLIEEEIHKWNENIDVIKKSKDKKFDMDGYDNIYIKYIDNIYGYTSLDSKNIYISDLLCNLDLDMYKNNQKIPRIDLYIELSEQNEIRVFSMYDYIEENYPEG